MPASTYQTAIISISFGRFSLGDVLGLGEIFRHVMKLPTVRVQIAQFLLGDGELS